ncbi:MAG: hypothetical protein KDD47_23445, partial [Acidobacteria bacterium]|nr:hypothetical protein [Acidobacteriota bacterium]
FRDFHQQTVTEDGQDGLTQVQALIDAITDQGEGQTEGDADIPEEYRNTADGFHSSWPHFRKFKKIRASKTLPETWEGVKDPDPKSPGGKAQKRLLRNFRDFMGSLEELFSGGDPKGFGAAMSTLGANILTCWQNGAIPKFPQDGKS